MSWFAMIVRWAACTGFLKIWVFLVLLPVQRGAGGV